MIQTQNQTLTRNQFSEKLQNAKTIVIKVGSARLSGSELEINDFLFSLADDIRELRDFGKQVILVSSGAVAQGRKVIAKYISEELGINTPQRQALAALGQNQLMNLYEGIFSRANIPIAQILFGTLDIQVNSGYENLQNTFQQLLRWNVLPIINENDSIAIEELKLGDNDILSSLVTLIVGADLLIILTGVDGFLIDGNKVDFLYEINDYHLSHARGPEGPGTGGMNTKLKAAKILLENGIPTAIINGKEKNCVSKLLKYNKSGTLIANNKTKKYLTKEEIKQIFKLD